MTISRSERVVVVGASGGIGRALCDLAEARGAEVVRVSRPAIDVDDERSFAVAAEVAGEGLSHVIVASGLLHHQMQGPERDWRQISPDWMLESFKVNAVLPALVAKHFLPRLRTAERAVFAVLSARVGSIGDNRLGGWHSYRASKAAANQLVRTFSVELRRKNPLAIAVALHPGTVDTPMSEPFQRNVQPEKLFTPAVSAGHLWRVIDGLEAADSGGFRAWDGQTIPW
ncbi:MAG: SDR family NAD(P)-dependent oxidoreductase [Sandaracinobacteroides sp.]